MRPIAEALMVSVRDIWRGALTRVFPASASLIVTLGMLPLLSSPGSFRFFGLGVLAIELLGIAVGYGGALMLLRRRLASDAGVAGRRAVVVGFCAPLAVLTASMLVWDVGLGRTALISVGLAGAVTTGLFAPWLGARADAADTDVLSTTV